METKQGGAVVTTECYRQGARQHACSRCNGHGQVTIVCAYCGGHGRVTRGWPENVS